MDYGPVFDAAAAEWNVDPTLLRAVSAQESGGNAGAVSKAGARGLMGVMPKTGRAMGVTDPADPAQNIYAGAKYLSQALDAEKSPEDALRYYHGGPDWRKAYGPESQGYVPAVSAHYQRIAAANAKGAPAVPSTAPSFDDFLARTGANDKAPTAADAQAAFLARTGAAEAPPAEVPTSQAAPAGGEYGLTGEPGEFNGPPGVSIGTPGSGQRILDAAKAGWQMENPLMSPKLRAMIEQGGPVGMYITSPLLQAGGGALALGAAGMRGVQQGLVEAGGGDAGPGRDIAAYLDVAPILPREVPVAPGMPAPHPLAGVDRPYLTAPAADAVEASMRARNALAPPDMPTMTVRPGEAVPQSVGAAASSSTEAGMTPREVQAYRSTAEGQKLLEPQPVGVPDRAQYVQGSNPNTAEIEQTVNTARELKSLNLTAAKVSQEAREIAAENNDARAQHFAQTAGSPVDVVNAKAVRSAQAEKDLAATWANKKPADARPVIDAADQIKASPDGRRPIVRNAVDAVTKELYDKDGALITDPEQLYGVRKHLDDLMSKEAGADDPKSVRAFANLATLKTALDAQIERAAPGFGQYLQNFADASKRIDEMEVLQKHEPKLFDTGNRMTYAGVQRMMRNIVDSRQAPGINPYQSISDATMQRLWALRDDLRRSASAQELARTPGSDTAQNIWDAAKGVMGGMAGEAAIHGTANALLGPLGSPVAAIGKNVLNALRAGKVERQQTARGMQMLRPDPSQLYNPLAGP